MSAEGALNPGVRRREVFGWAMYDFANSGYTTVVLTAVFNAYFVSTVARNAAWATLAWTLTLAVSYAAIMVLGPILGAWADAHAAKKRALFASTVACVAATAGLAWVGPGDIVLAVVLLVVSNVAFSLGENLTAAFLTELARPAAVGKVSGWGWSLGYGGGILALALSLAWVLGADARGSDTAAAVPGTMLITAAVFAVASAFTFVLLRERAVAAAPSADESHALVRLARTARHAANYRDLFAVFACGTFYQAGVTTVIALAAIYAEQVMGFKTKDTIVLILAVNVTAGIGAFAFGYAQDRLGKVRALRYTLWIWIAMVLVAWGATTQAQFWVAANLAGLAMGSSQSAGRALVSFFSPPERTGEFFGLWGAATRLAGIIGPVTYGAITWLTGGDHRLAIACTGLFFVIALVLLSRVDEGRGRRAALASA
jgi:UMF1 family MFS transporter